MRAATLSVFLSTAIAASYLLGGCSSSSSPAATTGGGGSTGAAGAGAGGGAQLGPGAVLKCDSSGKNAWETYGVGAFVAVNEEIFTEVGAEITKNGTANLGTSFTKIGTGNPPSTADDAATFKGNLAAFLVFAYGGPSNITYTDGKMYTGPQDMVAAHLGLAITSAQYDYFVGNIIVPSLLAKGVKHGKGGAADPDDVSSCFAPIVLDAAFKASIVGH